MEQFICYFIQLICFKIRSKRTVLFPVSKSPPLQQLTLTWLPIPRKTIYFATMIPAWTSWAYRPATFTTNKAIPLSCVDVKPLVSSIPYHITKIRSNSPKTRTKIKWPATLRSEVLLSEINTPGFAMKGEFQAWSQIISEGKVCPFCPARITHGCEQRKQYR